MEKIESRSPLTIFYPPTSKMSNTIRWYESVELDAPELNSPQPCPRGIHCAYMVNKSGIWEPGCCRGVHPGEEGTGRRIFPARSLDGCEQPACVRLTGRAGYYERRRLRLSWGQWCEQQGIPYTPIKRGDDWEPVVRAPLGGRHSHSEAEWREDPRAAQPEGERSGHLDPRMQSRGFLGMPGGAEAARVASGGAAAPVPEVKLTKNQRKRAKRRLPPALGSAEQEQEAAAEREYYAAFDTDDYTADEMIQMQCLQGMEVTTRTCEDLEAELRAGAHSPKPAAAPPRLNLSGRFSGGGMPTNGFRSGECSPDCSCPDGWTCGDRIESRRSEPCTPLIAGAVEYEEQD